ncbi:hypothetical protein [Vibrio metschnikovii]|uniref:hypothetical protein n=1 Tax=Vibrio metschnikovii TaxID=28172 RepID=UPI0016446BB8|nr:hypothetical protein [Vibrio metschnikovii]MBC3620323.1 hypothetical protein [Vibrio metschnikovii]
MPNRPDREDLIQVVKDLNFDTSKDFSIIQGPNHSQFAALMMMSASSMSFGTGGDLGYIGPVVPRDPITPWDPIGPVDPGMTIGINKREIVGLSPVYDFNPSSCVIGPKEGWNYFKERDLQRITEYEKLIHTFINDCMNAKVGYTTNEDPRLPTGYKVGNTHRLNFKY